MFTGVNKVCAQCLKPCKQFEQMTLVNCPKFSSGQKQGHPVGRADKSARYKKTRRNLKTIRKPYKEKWQPKF